MKLCALIAVSIVSIGLLSAKPATAHHSYAMFDKSKEVTGRGRCKGLGIHKSACNLMGLY